MTRASRTAQPQVIIAEGATRAPSRSYHPRRRGAADVAERAAAAPELVLAWMFMKKSPCQKIIS